MTGWGGVAARGTDPELLARAVACMLRAAGSARALARAAVERELAAGPGTARARLADLLAPGPAALVAAATVARVWTDLGVRAAVVGDPCYPSRLGRDWPWNGAPLLLAWRGPDGGLADVPAVAIVGARRATSYGTGVAAWLAEAAGAAGALVVSGGAVGIDAAAHGAAAGTPGGTAVVLGCGHDVAYPRVHARPGGLFDRILEGGGWLAGELLPGTPPRPANVLARNRIVAGLADVVVVVEGSERSGSLATASRAADRGIPVMAVPGDVRAPGSAAPHQLLAEGAAPCRGPADLLAALGAAAGDGEGQREAVGPSCLPRAVRAELEQRWPRPVRVDELSAATGEPAGRLLAALTRARVAGEVADSADGVRLTRAPSGWG